MRAGCVLVATFGLAACGDNASGPPDAPGPTVYGPCIVKFSGNFKETATLAQNCGVLDATGALGFSIPSTTLATSDAISIGLTPPAAVGAYTSANVQTWSAEAQVTHNSLTCVYLAGSTAVPNGSFTLSIVAVDEQNATAHGRLVVEQNVLAGAETNCGIATVETVDLTF